MSIFGGVLNRVHPYTYTTRPKDVFSNINTLECFCWLIFVQIPVRNLSGYLSNPPRNVHHPGGFPGILGGVKASENFMYL